MTQEHLLKEIELLDKRNASISDYRLLLELAIRTIGNLERKIREEK